MQRRAAALYSLLFIILAVGAYGTIVVAEEPAVSVDNPEYAVSADESFTVLGREYTVTSIGDNQGDVTWVNESAMQTESWDNDSTITLDNTEFRVLIEPGDEPAAFELREVQTLDENVTTADIDGETFVVEQRDGDQVLVPESEYLRDQFGEPETRTVSLGEDITYQNATVQVSSVTGSAVTISWQEPEENTVSMSEGDIVTLNDREFVAHFSGSQSLELSRDVEAYNHQLSVIDKYNERISGLWGVTILGSLGAITLLGLAFLPSRY